MLLFLSVISPLHIHCTPGESCAEGRKDEVVAFLQFFLKVPDAEGQRAGTAVSIAFRC